MITWTDYFLKIALLVAQKSKDPSTQAGAVITTPDNRIIATGYNGLPRKVIDSKERLTNRAMKLSMVIHAEKNAIYTAGRDLTNHKIWITHSPCSQCAAAIVQTGIIAVSCIKPPDEFKKRWEEDIKLAQQMFTESGVHYQEYPIPL